MNKELEILLNKQKELKKELELINDKIYKYKNNLLHTINKNLRKFAMENDNLFNGCYFDSRWSIDYNKINNTLNPIITRYSFSCFVEFSSKEVCQKAIDLYKDYILEYCNLAK